VLLEDDFSDDSTGWISGGDRFVGENTIQEIAGGRFTVEVTTADGRGGPDTTGLAVPNAAELESLGDVTVEVTVTAVLAPPRSFYGVICREVDFDNFYGFVILDTGGYSIFREQDRTGTELAGGDLSTGRRLSNSIRADCVGDTLTMYADGERVAEVRDPNFTRGAVGFLAETRGTPGLEVAFDDLVIRRAAA